MTLRRTLVATATAAILAVQLAPPAFAAVPIAPPTFEFGFGTAGLGVGQLHSPNGIAIAPDGSMYVGDRDRDLILKYDATGTFLFEFGPADAYALAFDHLGRLAATDVATASVRVFDQNGTPLFSFGGPGSGPGQFATNFGPSGIAVDGQGRYIVADLGNSRAQIFDQGGTFVSAFAQIVLPPGQIFGPHGVAVDAQDRIYLSWNSYVDAYAPSGAALGTVVGGLSFPEGLAIDAEGRLYIANTLSTPSGEIIIADLTGAVIGTLEPSASNPFTKPHAMAIAGDRVVFTHGLNFEPVSVYRWQRCNGLPATRVGTPGDDVIPGTSGDDVIVAGAGNDQIRDAGGNDAICGEGGIDLILGDGGDDLILGGNGPDLIDSGPGNDLVTGDLGADILFGGPGNDTIRGFDGFDICIGGPGTDTADSCEFIGGVP